MGMLKMMLLSLRLDVLDKKKLRGRYFFESLRYATAHASPGRANGSLPHHRETLP